MNRCLVLAMALMACREQSPPALEASEIVQAMQDTPDVQAARQALAEGQAWRAYQLLRAVLSDSTRRTPAAMLLAAQAAAAWDGWDEVSRLLDGQPWLDSFQAGAGRALLAYSSLELEQDSAALRHAELASRATSAADEKARRLVILARALDRLKADDSAHANYERAAAALPALSDWLYLRAAGLERDSVQRARQFARIRSAAARSRIAWTDAQARERSRDFAGAARAFRTLGAHATSLRLRLTASPDSAERAAIRRELIAIVEEGRSPQDARLAIEVLDLFLAPLTPAEELIIARRSTDVGPATRAEAGFRHAFAARLGTDADRFAYAGVLARLDRHDEAAVQFGRITARPLAGQASYFRARSLLRDGKSDGAKKALERTARVHARDTVAASLSLFLLGDLATDNGRDAEARRRYLDVARRYPSSAQAAHAAFRAAMIAFVAREYRTAARELDALASRPAPNLEALAALYWSGRSWDAAGESARARERWRTVTVRDPLSYYAMVAAYRLGEAPWSPPAAPDSFARIATVDSALARVAVLQRLGMATEARMELDQVVGEAPGDRERLLATAAALRDKGEVSRAAQLARHLLAGNNSRDARTYRLLYPLTWRPAVIEEATRNRIDVALMVSLIRQESGFNPCAVSPAGAMGMMQLMPSVARQLATSLKFPFWHRALLFQPDVNLQLGAVHFAASLRRYDRVEHALAAYNAGGTRVTRWNARPGAEDPEVFVERIPFVETRDYVRIVLRNRALYRALYPDLDSIPSSPQ